MGRWLPDVVDPACRQASPAPLIGVLPGEGIGNEVVSAALEVLDAIESAGGEAVQIETGGPIGHPAESSARSAPPAEAAAFFAGTFARGGAILPGPGGGRYVYDLRRRLDLYLKLVPVSSTLGLAEASPLHPDSLRDLDLLLVRENLGGIYQGHSQESVDENGRRL